MDPQKLVEILNELPQVRLRLIDFTWKLVDDDGKIDPNRLAFYSKEVNEAIDEARAYQEETRKAVACLMDHFQSWLRG
jgi:hypothetical protein